MDLDEAGRQLQKNRPNIIWARFYKADGTSLDCWMCKKSTIATVLIDWTPEALQNTNPVVVVDDSEVMLDVMLGDIPLRGGILHMKIQEPRGWRRVTAIQEPIGWQRVAPCSTGECPDFDDHCSSAIPANPFGLQRVTLCSTGECPDFDDYFSSAIPANIVTVVVHQEDGQSKQVLMRRTTAMETVLKVFTPAALKNANPVLVFEGREVCVFELRVGTFPTNGNLVHFQIRRGMQW